VLLDKRIRRRTTRNSSMINFFERGKLSRNSNQIKVLVIVPVLALRQLNHCLMANGTKKSYLRNHFLYHFQEMFRRVAGAINFFCKVSQRGRI
jgi:hypothetical protein